MEPTEATYDQLRVQLAPERRMIWEEIRSLRTGKRELRKFGLLVGGVFALLGLWFWVRGKPHHMELLVPGVLLMLLGAAAPRALKLIYLSWMSLAFLLGFAVSTALLTLLFFLIVTPVGLIARLAGRDFLSRRFDPHAATYWIRRERSAPGQTRNYERQF